MNSLLTYQNMLDGFYGLVAIGAVFYFFGQYRKGKLDQEGADDSDALTTIKIKDATINALQSENTFLKAQSAKYGERIAVLEADNLRLQALIQNRNPELELFMKTTSQSLLLIERSLVSLLQNNGMTISSMAAVEK